MKPFVVEGSVLIMMYVKEFGRAKHPSIKRYGVGKSCFEVV
jgi:hypothetical protein